MRTPLRSLALPLCAILLGLAAACGEPGPDEPGPPLTPAPVMDPAITAATATVLRSPTTPDAALRAYQGEVERVLAQNTDLKAATDLLYLSSLASLDAQTAGAFATLEASVDGRVYSTAFATAGSTNGEQGLAAPLCTGNVDEARTVVYFVNGIGNNIFGALNSLHLLQRQMEGSFSERAEFRLFYNASGARSPEAECSHYGLVLNDPRVSNTMRERIRAAANVRCSEASLRGLVEDFAEAASQWLDLGDEPPEPLLVGRLRELILSDVLSGKKVLLVAHSQGNLYVEAALRGMPSVPPDGNGPVAASVAVVAVASPIRYTAVSSAFRVSQVQLFGDIIHAVPGSPSSTVENENSQEVRARLLLARATGALISTLGANGWARAVLTIAAYAPVFHAAYRTHGFSESYLAYPASASVLAAAMLDADSRSVNGRDTLGQGFFQATLTWNIAGDIDLHLVEPTRAHVYWASQYGDAGRLDHDDIVGTGPENYFVCSPGKLIPGSYALKLNNFNGTAGTQATVHIRAGSQFRIYTQLMDGPNQGSTLIDLVTVTYGTDGSFTFSR
jgi:uncharacterized protein YfaP (DUF2135 family)